MIGVDGGKGPTDPAEAVAIEAVGDAAVVIV